MAKINNTTTYPNTTPSRSDHLPGTDVSNTTNDADGETVTFTIAAILGLIQSTDLPAASTSAKGVVELATNAETGTGSDTTRAVTPSGLAALLGSLAAQDADDVAITGGAVDGAVIGGTTPAAGSFTVLSASNFVGGVMAFAMSTAPTGWLECDGAAVSRTSYAALFTAIGTTYGVGDGSTTFNLPDLRGEFIRGFDNGRGVDSARALGSSQLDQMQRITGQFQAALYATGKLGAFNDAGSGIDGNTGTGQRARKVDFDSADSPDARASSTTDGETRSRNVALMFCIKY